MKLASGFLCGRRLTVSHLVLDQTHPVVVAQIHAGQFERRPIPALLDRARLMVKRDQGEESLRQMLLYADLGTQQTVEAFHGARRSHYLIQRFVDLTSNLREILNSFTPILQANQRRQVSALSLLRLVRARVIMP